MSTADARNEFRKHPVKNALLGLRNHSYTTATALILAGGVAARLDNARRSLSVGESWVANAATAQDWHEVFYYRNWLQTSPPLFMLFVRFMVRLFGLSDLSFRAVPLLFSLLALVWFAILTRRLFTPLIATVGTALLAFSPYTIAYSKDLKQYSSDLAATCLILLVVWSYIETSDRRRFLWLLATVMFAILLSYTAVFVVPLALLAILIGSRGTALRSRVRAARCAILTVTAGTLLGFEYLLFVRPNSSPLLTNFWRFGYPSSFHFREFLRYYSDRLSAIAVGYYLPADAGLADPMKRSFLSAPLSLQLVAAFLALALAVWLIRPMAKRPNCAYSALFLFVPLLTLLSVNALRFYPIGSLRLTLFIAPCSFLLAAAVLETLLGRIPRPLDSPRTARLEGDIALVIGAVALLIAGCTAASWDTNRSEDDGHEEAVRFLQKAAGSPLDSVYVHASEDEPMRLYLRMLGWQGAPVHWGTTGYPCCKRTVEERPDDPLALDSYVSANFDAATGERRSLWLTFTDLPALWNELRANEILIIDEHLLVSGCRKTVDRHFGAARIQRFECGADRFQPS